MIRKLFYLAFLTFAFSYPLAPARADCTDPVGPPGRIIYNQDHNVLQYCDDTDWIAFPKAVAGSGTPDWTTANEAKVTAADGAAGDYFGHSVAISGDVAMIGAYQDDSNAGSVYVFTRSGGVWSQTQKLIPADAAAGDYFGYVLAISGDTAIIGAHFNDDNGLNSGSAYIFTNTGGVWGETQKLTAADAASQDRFGYSVEISGSTAIIGAYQDDDGGSNSGSAYIFTETGGVWSQSAKLTAADAASSDNFGGDVSISDDVAIVGARNDDDGGSNSGSAYIFTRSGPLWNQSAKLTASDAAANDWFGHSVAITNDVAIVGAIEESSRAGAAYVFSLSGGIWNQTQKLTASDTEADDTFGGSIEISGDIAIIAAYGESNAAGAAYIFTRSGVLWNETAKFTASDAEEDDFFGVRVAISGESAIIGAHMNDDAGIDSGSAYFYTAGGGASVPYNWDQAATETKATANDAAAGDQFGVDVAISGNLAVVGADRDDDLGADSGAAYIFERSNGVWTQVAKLTASDGAAGDYFGHDVAISGETVIVGAYQDDDTASNSGSAYIFTRSGGVWSEQQKLNAADPGSGDYFGRSVGISGDTAIIGAYFNDDGGSNSGSAYIFTRSGGVWSQTTKLLASDDAADDLFGRNVAISGDLALVGSYQDDDNGSNSGSAYIFTRSGGVWTETEKLTASDGAADDYFGYNVAIDGDVAVIGAYRDDDPAADAGSAYVFRLTGGVWTEEAKLLPSDGAGSDHFGESVSVVGDVVMVGSYQDDDLASASGSAYVFTHSGGVWTETVKFAPADGAASDYFGDSAAISGNFAIVASYQDDDDGSASGSVYFYETPWNCTAPERPPGTIIYNGDERVLQWCAGDEWHAAGPVGPVTAQTGCSGPDGDAGAVVYNADHNVMQYCDGADWIGIGK